jgi:hypothetical protein
LKQRNLNGGDCGGGGYSSCRSQDFVSVLITSNRKGDTLEHFPVKLSINIAKGSLPVRKSPGALIPQGVWDPSFLNDRSDFIVCVISRPMRFEELFTQENIDTTRCHRTRRRGRIIMFSGFDVKFLGKSKIPNSYAKHRIETENVPS